MNKSILLVNDVTGYGRVSTFAMLPVMTRYGLHPYILPTALVSNTLDYGISETLDTTEFMRNAIDKWRKLGFNFDYISTGFICNEEQVSIIYDLIDSQDSPFVFVDPIMADGGELYPGMYPGAIECNRRLASKADILLPNFTEAKLLSEMFVGRDWLCEAEYYELSKTLLKLGSRKLVIKGCKDESGSSFNLVADKDSPSLLKLPFERIDADFIGTGDIFSSVLISEYMTGATLEEAVNKAASFIRLVINDNIDGEDPFDLKFERTLRMLDK